MVEPWRSAVVDHHGVDAARKRRGLLHLLEVRQDLRLVGSRDAEAGEAEGRERRHEGLEGLGLQRHVDGVEAAGREGRGCGWPGERLRVTSRAEHAVDLASSG